MALDSAVTFPLPIPDAVFRLEPPRSEADQPPPPGNRIAPVAEGVIEAHFEGIATYRIEHGHRIVVQPEPGVDHEMALFYLKAAPFGLLVLQRGELPLHASAVLPADGKGAILVAGDPGAGKSTTAALLVRRGGSILNDDISRITLERERPTVWPGFQSLKLGDAVLPLLQLEGAGLPRTPGVKDKRYWHLEGAREPAPVAAMFILENPDGAFVAPRRLVGMEILQHLYRHTFRQILVKPLGFHEAHFRALAAFAQAVPCYRVEGNHAYAPEAFAELLEQYASQADRMSTHSVTPASEPGSMKAV